LVDLVSGLWKRTAKNIGNVLGRKIFGRTLENAEKNFENRGAEVPSHFLAFKQNISTVSFSC